MEIEKALDQISEIHGQLAKADVYRGYKAVPVALSGAIALVAAAVQARLVGEESFVAYWVGVAAVGAAISGGGIVYSYVKQDSRLARLRTQTVVGQLLPCMAAGIVATALIAPADGAYTAFLPGLWTILFSLGIFASRPYLPRIIGWVALYYLAAGTVLLALAPDGTSLSPWGMGLTFGIGQMVSGIVLYWNLERKSVR